MFARQAFRAAHVPVRAEFRRYASTEPSKGGNSTLRYGIGSFLVLIPITAYFYSPQRAPPAAKRGVKGRAEGNQEAKEEPVGGEKAAPQKTFLGDNQWVSLKLENVEQVSPNAKKFRFALPSEDHVSGLKIASALLTKYKGPTDEKPVMRPYTPVSDEDQKGYLELVVKKYEKGPMSTHIHDMAVDQRLDFKGPLPKYPWEANKHDHIALIAGGTGITPMFQLTHAIFNNPDDKTKVTLVFGNVSESDILLKPELSKLENEFPNRFTAFYVLDNPPKEWAGGKGFITKELLEKVLPDKNANVKVFVCGPPGMYKAISGTKPSPQDQGELTGILKDLGWDKDKVYKF